MNGYATAPAGATGHCTWSDTANFTFRHGAIYKSGQPFMMVDPKDMVATPEGTMAVPERIVRKYFGMLRYQRAYARNAPPAQRRRRHDVDWRLARPATLGRYRTPFDVRAINPWWERFWHPQTPETAS